MFIPQNDLSLLSSHTKHTLSLCRPLLTILYIISSLYPVFSSYILILPDCRLLVMPHLYSSSGSMINRIFPEDIIYIYNMFFAKTSWIFPCSKRLDIPIIWISWTCRMISQAPRLLRATLKASSAVKLHGPTDRRCKVTSPGGCLGQLKITMSFLEEEHKKQIQ